MIIIRGGKSKLVSVAPKATATKTTSDLHSRKES